MNKRKYKIKIIEIYERIINVEANNIDEAFDKIKKMYKEDRIILDDSNYVKTKFIHVKDNLNVNNKNVTN